MATSIQPKSKKQYVDFDEYIDYQLQKTRSNIKAADILTALVGVAVLVLSYVLLFVVFDHWVVKGGFSPTTRILMLSGVLIAAAAWIGWKVVFPYLKRVTGLYAAREIEKFDPGMKSNLLNLIDLQQSGREISEEIRTSLEKRAAVTLSHMNIEDVVDRRPLMRMSYVLLAVIVLWCGYSLFSEKTISSSVLRALFPTSNVEVSTQTKILEVKPGDVEIQARTQLEVIADLAYHGDDIPDVRLYYSSADGQFLDEPIEMRPDEEFGKRFRCVMTGENGRGILQNLTYRIESGDARTRDFEITVVQSPSATVETVHYEYPAYMELPSRTQQGGHIETWEGSDLDESKVTISATANMPVTSARLLFSDTEDISQRAEERSMQIIDGTKLTVTLDREIRFRSDGTYPHYYRIECKNKQRQTTIDPTLYSVKIRPDKRPVVELLDPVRDLERPVNAIVPLLIRAHDPDFKLRSVTLKWEKNGERLPAGLPLFDGNRKSFGTTYHWKLDGGEFKFKPGDTLTYWIEARDNKPPTGNRTNTTRRMKIDFIAAASQEDVQEQLKQDQQRQQEKLEELKQQANQDTDGTPPPNQEDSQEGEQGDSEQQGEKSDQEDPQGKKGEQPTNSASRPDGNKGEQKQADSPQQSNDAPQPNGENGEGEQQSFDPNGADDQKVTQKLLEQFHKEQQQKQQQPGESNEKGNNTGDKQGQPDNGKKGKPGDKQGADAQPTEDGTNDKNKSGSKSQPGKKQTDPDSNSKEKQPGQPSDGQKTPADDATETQPEKATGDEKGTGTPNKDPNADPTQMKDPKNIQREPGQQPALKKGDDSDISQKPADLDDKTKKGTPNAGKQSSQNPDNTGKKQNGDDNDPGGIKSSPTQPMDNQNQSPTLPKQSDAPQDNEDLKGAGEPKGNNQKNKQGGEGGSNKPSDQGNSGSKQPGGGDSTAKPGKSQPSKKPTGGKSGSKQGAGSKSGDAQNKKGKDSSQGGKQSSGKSGSKSGGSKGSSKGGSKGDGKGKSGSGAASKGSSSSGGTGGAKSGNSGGAGKGDGTGEDSPDDANADYSKKAANLVLKRLENELQRGEVDKKLLEELGWNENDMKNFAERLRKNLREEGEGETPQSKAGRLQFQEWLKNLDLKSTGRKRTAGDVSKREYDPVLGRRTPPPAEYRDLFEAYTRGLNRRIKNQPKKKQ